MHATRNWATMGVSFSDPPFEILDWPVALNQMIKITLNWKNSHFFEHPCRHLIIQKRMKKPEKKHSFERQIELGKSRTCFRFTIRKKTKQRTNVLFVKKYRQRPSFVVWFLSANAPIAKKETFVVGLCLVRRANGKNVVKIIFITALVKLFALSLQIRMNKSWILCPA